MLYTFLQWKRDGMGRCRSVWIFSFCSRQRGVRIVVHRLAAINILSHDTLEVKRSFLDAPLVAMRCGVVFFSLQHSSITLCSLGDGNEKQTHKWVSWSNVQRYSTKHVATWKYSTIRMTFAEVCKWIKLAIFYHMTIINMKKLRHRQRRRRQMQYTSAGRHQYYKYFCQ